MIQRVIIACYKKDYWLTEICCSSIRYWYPDIPISVIYDYSKGAVDFSKLVNKFGVSVIDLPIKKFGWGLSKIEALFLPERERVLILDSDTVLLGNVIDYLDQFQEDFVVSADWHSEPHAQWMKECYFDMNSLLQIDNQFEFPGYSFNTGQFVATTGLLKRSDFESVIEWHEFPEIKQPNVFACVDQGILNYILPKAEKENQLTIGKADFLMGIRYPDAAEVKVEELASKFNPRNKILHWAGCNTSSAAIYVVANRKHRIRELVHGCRGARLVTRWGEGSEIYRLRKSIERRRPSPAGKSQRKTQRRAKDREPVRA